MMLMWFMLELLEWNSHLLRNMANVISIELSLVYSFIVYRVYVWRDAIENARLSFWQQLALYHGSAGLAIAARGFVIFPILDNFGIHYISNTLVGIGLSCLINYSLFEQICLLAIHPNSYRLRANKANDLREIGRHLMRWDV